MLGPVRGLCGDFCVLAVRLGERTFMAVLLTGSLLQLPAAAGRATAQYARREREREIHSFASQQREREREIYKPMSDRKAG